MNSLNDICVYLFRMLLFCFQSYIHRAIGVHDNSFKCWGKNEERKNDWYTTCSIRLVKGSLNWEQKNFGTQQKIYYICFELHIQSKKRIHKNLYFEIYVIPHHFEELCSLNYFSFFRHWRCKNHSSPSWEIIERLLQLPNSTYENINISRSFTVVKSDSDQFSIKYA